MKRIIALFIVLISLLSCQRWDLSGATDTILVSDKQLVSKYRDYLRVRPYVYVKSYGYYKEDYYWVTTGRSFWITTPDGMHVGDTIRLVNN